MLADIDDDFCNGKRKIFLRMRLGIENHNLNCNLLFFGFDGSLTGGKSTRKIIGDLWFIGRSLRDC